MIGIEADYRLKPKDSEGKEKDQIRIEDRRVRVRVDDPKEWKLKMRKRRRLLELGMDLNLKMGLRLDLSVYSDFFVAMQELNSCRIEAQQMRVRVEIVAETLCPSPGRAVLWVIRLIDDSA